MSERLPKNKRWSQPNSGDTDGDIYTSLNLDLRTNPGKLKGAPRVTLITKDDDASISNMGLPIAFDAINAGTLNVYAITAVGSDFADGSGKVLKNTGADFSAFANLTGDLATNQPTTIQRAQSDGIRWGSDLYVSTYATSYHGIAKLAISGPTWTPNWFSTTLSGTFNGSSPKNMWVGHDGSLYITDSLQIRKVTTAPALSAPITFTDYQPIWAISSSSRSWIALMSWQAGTNSVGEGFIGEWDLTGSAVNRFHRINAPSAMAGTVYVDTPYIIDAYGVLKKYNGSGFIEVARLPVANMNIEMPGIYNALDNERWIHHRGMRVVNNKIRINVNNFVSTGVYVDEMPSGVWEFDPNDEAKGLYHVGSPCVDSNDYGQQLVESVGALYPLKKTTGNMMAGYSYYTDSGSTNKKGIFYDDIATGTDKRSIFTTPFILSTKIQDTLQKVIYRFNYLLSGDKIITKSRVNKKVNLPFTASATWTSTTTFTSTDANFQYATVGDEVEVVQGKRSSTTAHISVIAVDAGTYTITLEDTIGSDSGSCKVRVDNFQKKGKITSTVGSEQASNISQSSTKTQVKTELRIAGDFEMDDLTVVSKEHQKIQ